MNLQRICQPNDNEGSSSSSSATNNLDYILCNSLSSSKTTSFNNNSQTTKSDLIANNKGLTSSSLKTPLPPTNDSSRTSHDESLTPQPFVDSNDTDNKIDINNQSDINKTSNVIPNNEIFNKVNNNKQRNSPTQPTNGANNMSVVTPFLVKHISDQTMIPKDNFHRYCYRHNPDVSCNKHTDEVKMKQIQKQLEKLPSRDQEAISHVWSIFSAAPDPHRSLILQGLLSQCCFPQLSFISQEILSLIRIDFVSTLPIEISLKILCYLDCASLCNAAQVSRKWKSLADDDRVWHHMCEQHIDRKCPNCGWGLPLMHMKRAREISIRNDDEHSNNDIPNNPNAISNSNLNPNNNTSDNNNPTNANETNDTNANANNNANNNNNTNANNNNDTLNTTASRSNNTSTTSNKRKIEEVGHESDTKKSKSDQESQQKLVLRKRPWKSVYSERFKLEKNWRKGIYKITNFNGHTDGITCLQFNRKYIMSGSYDSTIKIWKVDTGECLRTLTGHEKGVKSLVFDSQKLITGGLDSTIKVWNYHTGQCISTYRGHDDSVSSVDFSNKTIVSGSIDCTVKVWHVDSRTCYTLRGHTDGVNSVKIHLLSNTVFSASDDTTIRMWDLNTNQCLRIFGGINNNGHIGQVQCVIPLIYKDKLIEDEHESDSESQLHHHPQQPSQTLQQGLQDGDNVNNSTTNNGSATNTTNNNNENNNNVSSNINNTDLPNNSNFPTHLLTSSLDNTIKLWDVKTGKCIRTQFGHIEGVWSISADTFRIISGAHDGLVKVWDLQNGKCLHTIGNNSGVCCVGLSDSSFVTGSECGKIKMYSFE